MEKKGFPTKIRGGRGEALVLRSTVLLSRTDVHEVVFRGVRVSPKYLVYIISFFSEEREGRILLHKAAAAVVGLYNKAPQDLTADSCTSLPQVFSRIRGRPGGKYSGN